MDGIALRSSEIPEGFISQYHLGNRLHKSGSDLEYRFLAKDSRRLLPVRFQGQFQIAMWGNQDTKCFLPRTAWTWKQTLDEGGWNKIGYHPVIIPSSRVLANGIWYPTRQGVRGVIAFDKAQQPHVYVICRTPSRDYRVMTHTDRQPLLVDEEI
ncbi:hypothetical protein KIH39_25075 [Telmatocola sphagniphila]|jgi:hypothetical protein|uniref:Uncharacterized protein n=1 Tax=Telmatocola sphagniphila TaxID=1123043 RepID=A0A8E6B4M5_9BACT|nr:hypothetical protein [Telmatocola sphagniphila]QVL32070.1 hypothetical protein KIH39_25075 [Telmatocola sphagniphila]